MSGRPQAAPTVQVDNAEVIVTEWRFAPGAETGRHRHGHDYVVVPLTDGTLLLETPEGDRHAPLVAGQAYFRKAGVEHNVINASAHEVVFVETEIK
ncbi:TPA: cupin domain-containing protein [Pseudomonas aeruginosa]|uniref:beta-alanine degradation protein BauB n=1 Tax=Pseudomonas aeruginosa TaxID=287 RepID=UPI00053D0285|nr:beta-alanine degradation protein BauB [Pseudomonas aeruginosa]ELK4801675.1 cupin domain-containing protein [Pseudomonas aeruginosa]ELK4831576.1 cupin domain-containing protein [Pseudomonas aeruginosa]MBG4529605.1 cupin domain-containing protein [Pseudomonas aeruginosa]MBI7754100.1 cupin domain-containing protein [Pseudomonas aeruginosa]MCZ0892732.1 beta-alanine degradation protein BauB [Pseudomonas aeruginosa]